MLYPNWGFRYPEETWTGTPGDTPYKAMEQHLVKYVCPHARSHRPAHATYLPTSTLQAVGMRCNVNVVLT